MKQKKEVTTAVVMASAAGSMLAATDIPSMVDSVASDLTQAGIGTFCMLRAGVGLTCIKQLSDHSTWEARMMELFPNRSPRTLQRYMAQARDFMDTQGVTPEQAWAELSKYDATQVMNLMIASPEPLQLGTGDEEPAAQPAKRGRKAKQEAAPSPDESSQTFSQMLADYIQQRNRKKVKTPEPPKPLTKREKIEASIAEANRVVNVAADYVADGTWTLLPDDDLESTWAGFKAAADKLSSEMKARNRNK
jgi:hypothetical protein